MDGAAPHGGGLCLGKGFSLRFALQGTALFFTPPPQRWLPPTRPPGALTAGCRGVFWGYFVDFMRIWRELAGGEGGEADLLPAGEMEAVFQDEGAGEGVEEGVVPVASGTEYLQARGEV